MDNFTRFNGRFFRVILIAAIAVCSSIVNAQNETPVVDSPLPDLDLNEYFESDTIDLTGVFSDPDAGDELTLSVASSDPAVVTALIQGDSLIITEAGLGSSTVTVTATDNGTPQQSVSDAFTVTVNNVNEAPVVVSALPDLVLNEYFESDTIDLTGVFSDPDTGDELTLSVASSDPAVVTALIQGDSLIITEAGLGSSTVTVTATDNGTPQQSVSDEFTVTVNNVNEAPVVVSALPDLVLNEYFESDTIDLTGVFSDPDTGDELTLSVASSDPAVVTALIQGDSLIITEAGLGSSTVTVTATDNGTPQQSVSDAFTVTVNNVNEAPVVVSALPDLVLNEYFESDTIDLTGVFSDPDTGDELTLSVASSDPAVVTALIQGDSLIITEAGLGSSTVTVTATDNGTPQQSVSDAFTVTVNNVNEAPVVVSALPDLVLNEYFESDTIDLTGVFSDPDTGDELTLSVASSDPAVVTALIQGDSLIITEAGLGSSTVTVTATDNGTPQQSVSDEFTVTVNNVNEAPVVVSALPDLVLNEYFESDTIDLTGVFSDPDTGDELTLSVASSDPAVVTALIQGDSLIITEAGLGSSTVTVTATDNGTPQQSVSDEFTVTVNNVNEAPVVVSALPDLVLNEYFESDTIDLTGVFSDPDTGDELTLSVASSDPAVVTALIQGDSLIITEAGLGSSTVTVTATDNGTPQQSVSDAFTVTVNNVNEAPVVVSALPDLVLNEYFESDTIDLTGVFSDPDTGDELTLSVASSDPAVVTALIQGDSLIITEAGLGSSTVTVTATDNGTPQQSVSDEFTVTVNNVNEAPVVVSVLPDLVLNEYFESDTIDLTGVFSDPDTGDELTLSVASSDPAVVTALIQGDSLIITEAGLGSSTVTVTATDNGTPQQSVSDAFTVTVNNVNEAPVVVSALPDLVLNEYFESDTIDLTGVFSDPDAGDELTLSVASSDPAVVTALIQGDSLIITEAGLGSSTVTVTATDNGTPQQSVSDAFTVTVNGAPVVAAPIADQLLDEGFVSTTINLTGVFTDPESDALTYNIVSSDEAVVTVSLTDEILTITEVGLGTSEITVTASDGRISTNDQFEVSVNVNLPADWTYNPNIYNFTGQVTGKVYLEGTEVTRGYLGAFVNGQCRGYVKASYFSPAGHYVFDILSYSNNANGDTLAFKYYDPVTSLTYDIYETIPFEPDMILGTAHNPVSLNYCFEYVKSFSRGWNWFSINVLKDDMSLNAIMPEVLTEGDNIKNQTQTATYYDGFGWFGSLEFFDPTDFYKAFINVETEINTCGNSIDLENTTIDLVPGWNYLGYLPQESQPLNQALSSLTPAELDYIKSQTQTATYYNGLGWWGIMTQMSPGEGYMVLLADLETVQYPDPSAKKAIPQINTGSDLEGFNPASYEYSGTLTAKVFMDGLPVGSPEDLLMAYVGDQLRGTAKGLYFDPAEAFAFQMLIFSNIAEGEKIDFRYYHADSDRTYLCDESVIFSSDMIVADAYNSFYLNAQGATGINPPEQLNGFVLKTYPNPFTDVLQVHTTLEESKYMKLSVYDLMGKEIRILAEGDFDAGDYHYELDSGDLSPGSYIIRAIFDDEQVIQKVTFID